MAIEDGRHIAIRFSQTIVGDVSGLTPIPAGYKRQKVNLTNATATSKNQYSVSYSAANAIDGDINTYWRGTTQENWVAVRLNSAKIVTGLRLHLGSYYIRTFTFSGSNDGVNWTKIGGTYTAANSTVSQWYEFELDNSTAYLHYRIETVTTYNTSRVYLYEMELLETVPVGNESKFVVTVPMYDMVPGGTIHNVIVPVESVSKSNLGEDVLLLNFASGNMECIRNAAAAITVEYAGGTLAGAGGPVEAFAESFSPVNLLPKNNPNDIEHVEMQFIISSDLKAIQFKDTQDEEHLNMTLSISSALINIADL